MPNLPRDRAHLKLRRRFRLLPYVNPRRGRSSPPPDRNIQLHGNALRSALQEIIATARPRFERQQGATQGYYLEFELPRGQRSVLDKLENKTKKIELVAVQEQGGRLSATVFIPLKSADYFLDRVQQYRQERTKKGKPKNEALVSTIEAVKLGGVRSLYTDSLELFPEDETRIWWEVWVRTGKSEEFRRTAEHAEVEVKPDVLVFPENAVLLAHATVLELEEIVANSGSLAELRIASDSPADVIDLPIIEQQLVAARMVERLQPTANFRDTTICILDSGTNRDHPLLTLPLAAADQHTYLAAWGVNDSARWGGHGTGMAGVCAYGDLREHLEDDDDILLDHCLESVKILSDVQVNDPQLYGAITRDAVSRPEITAPNRRRAYCLAVTSTGMSSGKPSSWSAALDELAFGSNDSKRLIFVSVGNCRGQIVRADFPDRNDTEAVENPAQAWNAVGVGCHTEKSEILGDEYENWTPVAEAGEIGPTSRTSVMWDRQWPIKPDVLFEGGNYAQDNLPPAFPLDQLQPISINYRPAVAVFRSFGDTSCAAARAANFAARLLALNPEMWPETVRGLIVHSAEWTPAMRHRFQLATTQQARLSALRRYGYGVPDLAPALASTRDDVTLIAEEELTPFAKQGSRITTRHMAVHALPWPREALQEAGEGQFRLRVTLSYFVEPNPGQRGWSRRHRFASHNLRFALKRSTETLPEFEARMSSAIERDDLGLPAHDAGGDNWFLGQIRDVGSLHSDSWLGTGAELAQRDSLVVFPVTGWWKENPSLERFDRSARYSLIVSVRSEQAEIDIYTPIETAINVPIPLTV